MTVSAFGPYGFALPDVLACPSEWVELKYRGKYAGEVFIEMTFYSAVSCYS